ncbi:hypothetical protein DUT90_13170 [Polaribacter sp. WD7]|nr:hypothetical protein DUT90_13170 [Polaribacter sp. WD7]
MLVISLSALAQVKLETKIKITDEVIYENHDIDNAVGIQNDGRFNRGVYLVKITDSVQKEYFKKIIIE